MELLRLINVASLSLASIVARDPVPVAPDPALRVAFLTTIVPNREPVDVVRRTLVAATRIRHEGVLDVWLLDEGDSAAVRAMCAELGVRHGGSGGPRTGRRWPWRPPDLVARISCLPIYWAAWQIGG